MALDDHLAVEDQDLVDEVAVLVAVGDDDRVDALVDAFDGESEIRNAFEGGDPVPT